MSGLPKCLCGLAAHGAWGELGRRWLCRTVQTDSLYLRCYPCFTLPFAVSVLRTAGSLLPGETFPAAGNADRFYHCIINFSFLATKKCFVRVPFDEV